MLVLLLIFDLSLGAASAEAHDSGSDLITTIEKVRMSVVAVGTVRPAKRTGAERPPATYQGTGFVVGNGQYVVSNLHVVPEVLDHKNNEILAVFSGRGDEALGVAVDVIKKDSEHDLVLLKLKQGRLPPLQLGNGDFVREGSEIALTGFPIGMVLGMYPVTHRGIVSAITPIVIPAPSAGSLTAEQIMRLKKPFEVYQLDAMAYPGNSGSAVYDAYSGVVIGVVNSVFVKGSKEALLSTPSGITYAIPGRYVNELLQGLM